LRSNKYNLTKKRNNNKIDLFFKSWSRKGFAIFASLGKIVKISSISANISTCFLGKTIVEILFEEEKKLIDLFINFLDKLKTQLDFSFVHYINTLEEKNSNKIEVYKNPCTC
jgi:hypothetical protein